MSRALAPISSRMVAGLSTSNQPLNPNVLHALEAADGVVIIAVLFIVIRLQVITRRVRVQNFIGVAIYIAFGLVTGLAPGSAMGHLFLVIGLIVSAVFGVWRGLVMKVWVDSSGTYWRRGGVPVLIIWLLTLVARFGVSYYARARYGVPIEIGDLWLGFGVTIGVQNIVILLRRSQSSTLPNCTV
jgi:hypothetical protein